MDIIEKIKSLVAKINLARKAYYVDDKPIMTDAEYDKMYYELDTLEKQTGHIEPDSPTQTVGFEVVSKLEKVKHEVPMRSLENIFSVKEVFDFVQKFGECVLSLKCDGLSGRMRYNYMGFLYEGSTRGNGEEGENITHNIKHVHKVPLQVEHVFAPLTIDGELIIRWNDFQNINNFLPDDKKFSHPRNLAAGSVRQLDSRICAERGVQFVVWRVIEGYKSRNERKYSDSLKFAESLGFQAVPHEIITKSFSQSDIKDAIEKVRREGEAYSIPYDGFVIAVNDLDYAETLGETAHHPLHSRALKEEAIPEKTILSNIVWAVGKTGLVSPTGIFGEVTIDGSKISRATLHNVSYIKDLQLGIWDEIEVIKAAKIIPKIIANNTRSNTYQIPTYCPCCQSILQAKQEDIFYPNGAYDMKLDYEKGPVTLWCMNKDCPEKNLSKFVQFVSKQGMNIDGMSENTLTKLIDAGYIKKYADIYHLKDHPEIQDLEGFGKRSYEKMIASIEKSRDVKLNNYLVALSIPNVGKTVAKTLYKAFKGDAMKFLDACADNYDFSVFDDIGDVITQSIWDWWYEDSPLELHLIPELHFDTSEFETSNINTECDSENDFCNGKTFVVTGKFKNYTRDELGQLIEKHGGKLASSVSKKTSVLLTNEASGSSKYNKAMELGVPIMSENEFLRHMGMKVDKES